MLLLANCSQMVDEVLRAAAWINQSTYLTILSDDPNMCHVIQRSVRHILMQDQCDDRMSTCCGWPER
jgi:hypothetical protein